MCLFLINSIIRVHARNVRWGNGIGFNAEIQWAKITIAFGENSGGVVRSQSVEGHVSVRQD